MTSFTNLAIKSQFKVKLEDFIFCTLGTNGLRRLSDSLIQMFGLIRAPKASLDLTKHFPRKFKPRTHTLVQEFPNKFF